MFKVSYKGIKGEFASFSGVAILIDQIRYSYFHKKISSDHFYLINFNS